MLQDCTTTKQITCQQTNNNFWHFLHRYICLFTISCISAIAERDVKTRIGLCALCFYRGLTNQLAVLYFCEELVNWRKVGNDILADYSGCLEFYGFFCEI